MLKNVVTCTTGKNNKKYYFRDGKRISNRKGLRAKHITCLNSTGRKHAKVLARSVLEEGVEILGEIFGAVALIHQAPQPLPPQVAHNTNMVLNEVLRWSEGLQKSLQDCEARERMRAGLREGGEGREEGGLTELLEEDLKEVRAALVRSQEESKLIADVLQQSEEEKRLLAVRLKEATDAYQQIAELAEQADGIFRENVAKIEAEFQRGVVEQKEVYDQAIRDAEQQLKQYEEENKELKNRLQDATNETKRSLQQIQQASQEFDNALNEKDGMIVNLQNELKDCLAQKDELQQSIHTRRSEEKGREEGKREQIIQSLRQDIKNQVQEIQRLQQTNMQLDEENNRLHEENNAYTRQLEACKKELQECYERCQFGGIAEEKAREIEEADEQERKAREIECQSERKLREEAEAKLKNCKWTSEKVVEILASLRVATGKVVSLENYADIVRQQRETLENLQRARDVVHETKIVVDEQCQQELESKMKEFEELKTELENHRSRLLEEKEGCEEKLRAIEAKHAVALEALQYRMEAAETQEEKVAELAANIQIEEQNCLEQLEDVERQLQEVKRQNELLEAKVAALMKNLFDAKNEDRRYRERWEECEDGRTKLQTMLAGASEENTNLLQLNQDLSDQFRQLKHESVTKENTILELKRDNDELVQRVNKSQRDLQFCIQLSERYQGAIEKLEQGIKERDEVLRRARERIEEQLPQPVVLGEEIVLSESEDESEDES